jgi:transposase
VKGVDHLLDTKLLAYDYYLGFDVGKFAHHVTAIRGKDQKVELSKEIAQDEAQIQEVIASFSTKGSVLVAVDQKGGIGKLLVSVAKSMGVAVGFLTPTDFHHFSEGYSEVKTDAVDAFEISDLSMRMTHLLFSVEEANEAMEELRILCIRRDELVTENTREKNRLRALLVQIHPAFERVFGKDEMDKLPYLGILARYGGPLGIRRAGKKLVTASIEKLPYYRAKASAIAGNIFDAICEQKGTLSATKTVERIVKATAAAILSRKEEIAWLDSEIAVLYGSFAEADILSSMPGIGNVYGPVILTEIVNIDRFEKPGHLAAYAGVAPSKRQSGRSTERAKKKRCCNKRLKNAFCRSGWIATSTDAMAAEYYRKKRDEGKTHYQALLALARQRTNILYRMLVNGSHYEPRAT